MPHPLLLKPAVHVNQRVVGGPSSANQSPSQRHVGRAGVPAVLLQELGSPAGFQDRVTEGGWHEKAANGPSSGADLCPETEDPSQDHRLSRVTISRSAAGMVVAEHSGMETVLDFALRDLVSLAAFVIKVKANSPTLTSPLRWTGSPTPSDY